MREAELLQYLGELLGHNKFSNAVKTYKLKKSSPDELKLSVSFDLTKLDEIIPEIKTKELPDSNPPEAKINEYKKSELSEEAKDSNKESDVMHKTGFLSLDYLNGTITKEEIAKEEKPKEIEEEILRGVPKSESSEMKKKIDDLEKIADKDTPIVIDSLHAFKESNSDTDAFLKPKEVPGFEPPVLDKKINEAKSETEKVKSIPLSELPSMTADENGNIVYVDETIKPKKSQNITDLSTCKSLYKDHIFTKDEIEYVTAYLNKEITGGEGAELLGLNSASKFYSLVNRVKRSKNIKTTKYKRNNKKVKSVIKDEEEPKTKSNQKLTEADLDYIYDQVRKGDTLSKLSKDYHVSASTVTKRMHVYIKKHNLEPLFINGRRREDLNRPIVAPKKETNIVSKKSTVTVPSNTPDGWQIASDNKFHLVEKGAIVE